MEEGTRYAFSFQGLVPNGTYTIWHFPGAGGGAFASHPGDIHNVFRAGPSGAANFTVTGTAGSMTFGGAVSACTLPVPPRSDVGGLGHVFVVVYHMENQSSGDGPGPEETIAGHLVFMGR